jgi:Tat protein translocase TatC
MYPLQNARVRYPDQVQVVTFMFGTNRLGVFKISRDEETSRGLGLSRIGVSTFSADDFRNLGSLAKKLRQPSDTVSAYLSGQLSDATRRALTNYHGWFSRPGLLQTNLVQDFNKIVAGDCIFDAQRFAGLTLRAEAQQLLAQQPQGSDLLRLNRLLLEDAFPKELSRSRKFITLHLEPVTIGTNQVLGVRPDADSSAAERLIIPIVSFGPASAFIVAVQVAAYAGVIIASPFILYFVAAFVFPALKMKERKYVYRGMFYGVGLFFTGVAFCYFVLLPVALSASVVYTEWLGFSVPQWRAEDYISFVCKFMLGMGLGFEMPVILLVLVKIGILSYRTLAKARRYVIIVNFILGALLTTPEIITQILMALPLQFLYEITVWIAWWWERKAKKRLAAEEAERPA